MIMICSVLWDLDGSDGSDGGLGAVDPNAGIYPNIQVIQPFLSGAIDPIKVQYWDQTYYWGPDSDGNDACFKGTVGIEDSSSLAQETAPGPECPTSLGQVTPCNPAAAADTVASGAVQPAISGCEHDGAACTDILVPDITDEVTCESTVRQADPIAAGAAWFQNIDAPGTKGGTASHWWYGTRADKTFDAEDGYGGTQIDYISDATNINIAASGGGSGPTTRVNNIYLCSNKDVVNPAESLDVCTLSSLFGSCGYAANGDPGACKINNIGLVDGAYNVFIRSATPSEGFGDNDTTDGWPDCSGPCAVAYMDLTATGAQAQVDNNIAEINASYDVIILGFANDSGELQGTATAIPTITGPKKLLSLGGGNYHFMNQSNLLPNGDIINVAEVVKSVVAHGLDGVDFDIEYVDAGDGCPDSKPLNGCGKQQTSANLLLKLDSQIAALRSQLAQALGKPPIITVSPVVNATGSLDQTGPSITVSHYSVVSRSDLVLDTIIASGNVDAVIPQTYNGGTAPGSAPYSYDNDPRIVAKMHAATTTHFARLVAQNPRKLRVVVGIPISSSATYYDPDPKSNNYGTYQLWNGVNACPQEKGEFDNIADWIVYQAGKFPAGDGVSGYALGQDYASTLIDAGKCSPIQGLKQRKVGEPQLIPITPAVPGYYTKEVASRIKGNKFPPQPADPPPPPPPPPAKPGCLAVPPHGACPPACGSSVAYTDNQCDTPIQGSPLCPAAWAGANGTYCKSK